MNFLLKALAFISGLLLIAWGGMLISMGFIGVSTIPTDVSVRREGGERNDSTPNRYTWYISYDFKTRDGNTFSGHSQKIGNAINVQRPKHISYLTFFPYINAPSDQVGIRTMPVILIAAGTVVIWGMTRSRTSKKHPRRSPKAKNKSISTPDKMTEKTPPSTQLPPNPNAKAWLAKYRRNSRRWSWIFFCIVIVVIGILVRVGLEEWSMEWLYATGFAAIVTWLLAIWTRRKAESSWKGTVVKRVISEHRNNRNEYDTSTTKSYLVHLNTTSGKKKLRFPPALFQLMAEGTELQKVAGLTFPFPTDPDFPEPYCPVCSKPYGEAKDRCTACRSPVLSLNDLI